MVEPAHARASNSPDKSAASVVREQQKGRKLTKAEIYAKFDELINGHNDHNRKQVGACVYCVDCNLRLYQGRL